MRVAQTTAPLESPEFQHGLLRARLCQKTCFLGRAWTAPEPNTYCPKRVPLEPRDQATLLVHPEHCTLQCMRWAVQSGRRSPMGRLRRPKGSSGSGRWPRDAPLRTIGPWKASLVRPCPADPEVPPSCVSPRGRARECERDPSSFPKPSLVNSRSHCLRRSTSPSKPLLPKRTPFYNPFTQQHRRPIACDRWKNADAP